MFIVTAPLRFGFGLIAAFLWGMFLLHVFSPGTEETAFVFRFVQSLQPWLELTAHWLLAPVTWLLGWIGPYLPKEVEPWFPVAPAGNALNVVAGVLLTFPGLSGTSFGQGLARGEYLPLFPGVLDWHFPLAWVFWRWVEALLLGPLERLDQRLKRRKRQSQMDALDEVMRQSFAEPPAPTSQMPAQDAGQAVLFDQMVRQLKGGLETLPALGNVDPLTQLLHKKVFLRRLDQEMDAIKMAGGCLAVIESDMDDLGVLNELHSRAAGDTALRETARLFSQISTPQGKAVACRVEGGKLAMFLTQTSPDVAQRVAELLRVQISELKLKDFPKVRLSASFGVYVACFVPSNGSFDLTAEEMLTKAEGQMYKAKRSGKNQVLISVLP